MNVVNSESNGLSPNPQESACIKIATSEELQAAAEQQPFSNSVTESPLVRQHLEHSSLQKKELLRQGKQ